ncbi:unnamed protein product, partial [Chrysoparadoxa australica]
GCTNSKASNYNSEATKDNGSCLYEANVAFWMDNTEYLELTLMGVNTLKIYIDNQPVGTLPIEDFRDEAPNCFDEKTVSTKQSFGGSQSHVVEVEIRDQDEELLSEKVLTITANNCHIEQMVF